MGYNAQMRSFNMAIRPENCEKVLKALVDEAEENTVNGTYGPYQVGPVEMPDGLSFDDVRLIVNEGSVRQQQDLIAQFFDKYGYTIVFDEQGDICHLSRQREKWAEDEVFFDVFAKFVEKGSFIEMGGEDGEMWRMCFDGEHCREIAPEIKWPEPLNVPMIDSELLNAIENDDFGFVTNDINEFFDFMLSESEEWTFKELVSKLSPEMKEQIIFGMEWNGDFGKVDGNYYYHECLDDLREKPSVNKLIDNAKQVCENVNKDIVSRQGICFTKE